MKGNLTIVMYHYVRDLQRSRYPEIKGLTTREFEGQIHYLKTHYNVVTGTDVMDAIVEGIPLPERALLLTFDDGFIDHFTQVFPILDREDLSACFFPPGKCIFEDQVLDVHKIHFILASTHDKQSLVDHILGQIDENRLRYDLPTSASYWARLGTPSRWDVAEVAFCKRALQRDLPGELRQAIVQDMFRRFVTTDEASFSRELYMTPDQIRLLLHHGMYCGSHGYEHVWMDTLSTEEQEADIDRSVTFLDAVGAHTDRWIMSYPYGAYNDSLIAILMSRRCVCGLTTKVGLASIGTNTALTLPRLDTNDLPKHANAHGSEQTSAVRDSVLQTAVGRRKW